MKVATVGGRHRLKCVTRRLTRYLTPPSSFCARQYQTLTPTITHTLKVVRLCLCHKTRAISSRACSVWNTTADRGYADVSICRTEVHPAHVTRRFAIVFSRPISKRNSMFAGCDRDARRSASLRAMRSQQLPLLVGFSTLVTAFISHLLKSQSTISAK